jgi:plasmid stability protein
MRKFYEAIKHCLRELAAMHDRRSMGDEAPHILRSALSTEVPRPRNLGQAIHERFQALGGVDVPEVPREALRPGVDFGD